MHLGCGQDEAAPSLDPAERAVPMTNIGQLEGETIPYTIQIIDPDSVVPPRAVPLNRPPRTFTLPTNEVPVGKPRVVYLPDSLPTITPGENGVPPPDTIIISCTVRPAYQPMAQETLPLGMNESAIAAISNLGVEQGFSSESMPSILEDSQGDIWIGSGNNGVFRYDGARVYHYKKEHGFTDYGVWKMIEDSKGRIWFAETNGQLICYDGHQFHHYSTEFFEQASLVAIREDRKGNFWLGHGIEGLAYFDGKKLIHYTTEQGLSDNQIWDLALDTSGIVYVGTRYGGLSSFDGKSFVHLTTAQGLTSNYVRVVTAGLSGKIWLGYYSESVGSVSLYTPSNRRKGIRASLSTLSLEKGLTDPVVTSLREDSRGSLWIGTDGRGVYCLNGERVVNYHRGNGLNHNNVLGILEDSGGNIWLATWAGGASRVAVNHAVYHFTLRDYVDNPDVRCIVPDRTGTLWIGTFGSGVIHLEPGNGRWVATNYTVAEGLLSNQVNTMATDKSGNVWIGHIGQGMDRLEPSRQGSYLDGKLTHFTRQEGLLDEAVHWIEADTKGNIWFGTDAAGLTYYDQSGETGYLSRIWFDESCLNNTTGALQNSRGEVWFGTACGPIVLSASSKGIEIQKFADNPLSYSSIYNLQETRDGAIWFAAVGGEYRFQAGELYYFASEHGMLGDYISGIQQDDHDRLWVASEEGLTIMVEAFRNIPNSPSSYQFKTLDKSYGLKHLPSDLQNFYMDPDNLLWMGHAGGITTVKTDQLIVPETPPRIRLNTIDIAQSTVDYRRLSDSTYRAELPYGDAVAASFDSVVAYYNYPATLDLPHQRDHLTFHFSAIDWVAPSQLRYSYRLVGQDEGWSSPNKDSKADYRNLPPGDYKFQVRAIGAAKKWSEVFSYSFSIRPPWWLTWWAFVLYALLIATLLYGLYRYLLGRKLALQEARQLRELDHFKTRLYTNITHEFRTPLTVIMGMADQVLDNPKDWFREGLGTIKRNSRQLLGLVNQLLDLSKLESGHLPVDLVQDDIVGYLKYLTESFHSYAESKDLRLHLLTGEDALVMDFDPEKIQAIFSNLVGNAIKFTPAGGDVYISLDRKEENWLELRVKDNGQGISEDQLPHIFDRFYQADDSSTRSGGGTGIGLALTRELIHLLEGTIEVTSREGKGTEFSVCLPITTGAVINAAPYPTEGLVVGLPAATALPATGDPTEDLPLALLIEDNLDVLQYLSACLRGQYRLETATDGHSGIERAIKLVPDIIISDVMMPEKDGFEVVQTLKADERTSHIPIVLLTAKADQESRLTGLDRGADAYLAKPFDKQELEVLLRKLIQLRRRLSARYATLSPAGSPNGQTEAREDAFLRKVRHIVEENLVDDDFGISGLCHELSISRSQLHRKLNALTGKSTSQVIRTIRMQRAQELLRNDELNISEVGYAVGYGNPSHFTQEFIKEFGQAPSQYRKQTE